MTKTAHDTYLERQASIAAKIAQVQDMLKDHARREANATSSWGFAGDLGRVENLLSEILGENN